MSEKNIWLQFESRIGEYYDDLTKTEKRLADYMLENPEIVITSKASDIAEDLGVSPASVVRFCKRCGFSGLSELKLSLKREYEVTHGDRFTGSVTMQDSLTQIKHKVMNYHMEAVQNSISHYNEDAFIYAVNEILAAKHILITSFGGSKASALCLLDFMLQMDLPCLFWEDPSFCTMGIGRMTQEDLVIGITFSGRFTETVKNMKLARQRKARTIAITGAQNSPITEYADIVLTAGKTEEEYQWSTVSARIAEMTVVEILYMLLAVRKGVQAESFLFENDMLKTQRLPLS